MSFKSKLSPKDNYNINYNIIFIKFNSYVNNVGRSMHHFMFIVSMFSKI